MTQTEMEPEELQSLVEQLGVRDWRVVLAAWEALAQTGSAGIAAVVEGLSHPRPQVRYGSAGFLDHYGTDACTPALFDLARHDPVPRVRRMAVHALCCQRCKPVPLTGDLVDFFIERALQDENPRVRCEAVWGLSQQPTDARVVATMRTILASETHPDLRRGAHMALYRHDPEYRQATVEQAKARSRAIHEQRKRERAESPA